MPTKPKAWEVRNRDVLDLAACGEIVHFTTFFADKGTMSDTLVSPLAPLSESGSPTAAKGSQRPATAASAISATAATADDVVQYADKFGYTALHVAATHGHFAICALLLEHGADSNAATAAGVTPLHCAAEQGHLRIVRLLLEHGADPTRYTDRYELALGMASEAQFSEVVVLMEPLVHARCGSDDVLVAAARADMLFMLLQRLKGDTDAFSAVTDAGDNALHVVCKVGKTEDGHFDVGKFLVSERLVDVNAKNGQGMTALMYAARAENIPLILLLLQHGADATISSDATDATRTALSYTNSERIRVLLDEAERRCEFEALYQRRNKIPFRDRPDFVAQVTALKLQWDEAAANHRVYCEDAHVDYVRP